VSGSLALFRKVWRTQAWHCLGLATTLTAAFAGCRGDDRTAEQSGAVDVQLTELFSLEEPPAEPLGDFSSFLRWRDGWALADVTNRTIVVFDTLGRRLGNMGRPGGGPGEFRGLGPITLENESTLVALDNDLQRLSTWSLPQRAIVGAERPINAPNLPKAILLRADGLLLGGIWPKDLQSLALVEPVSNQEVRRGAKAPALYQGSSFVAGSYGAVFVAPMGDSLLIGWQLVDSIQLLGPGLVPVRKFEVPVIRRRGTPPDLIQRGRDIGDVVGMTPHTSLLSRLGLLSGDRIGIVHADLLREADGRGRTRGGSREVWLTVLNRSGEPLCVDLRIAARTQDIVRAHFDDGKLLIFRTSAEDGVTRVSSVTIPETCLGT